MTRDQIRDADREELAAELGAAGEYTEDYRTTSLADLRRRTYFAVASREGVPHQDRDDVTCEGDHGYGPCGTYTDWSGGTCAEGHEITFGDGELPADFTN